MSDDYITAGSLVDDRFAVGPMIGSGTFGIVYRAVDSMPGEGPELVALKTLRPRAFGMPDLVERFAREAEICAALVHPNVAQLVHNGQVDVGSQKDVPYMVMELVRGLPLGGLVSLRQKLNVNETAHIIASILDGLHVAHMQGILHRDLKPNNILIAAPVASLTEAGDGKDLFNRLGVPGANDPVWNDLSVLQVKVVDFGLGKMLETGGKRVKRLTRAGVAAGTAEYMAPEQVRAIEDIDHRADIYALAMLIHRLLTGRSAYEAKTLFEVAKMQVTDPLPPLPPELADHAISAVYRKAGTKDREGRYGTAKEMAYEIRKAADPAAQIEKPKKFEKPPSVRKRGFLSRLFGR